jgi:hypothetical protein
MPIHKPPNLTLVRRFFYCPVSGFEEQAIISDILGWGCCKTPNVSAEQRSLRLKLGQGKS